MTARVLPLTSEPISDFFSHFPPCIRRSALAVFRAAAKRRAMVCSAAETVLPKGVFMTIIPRSVAAALSILSVPTPARPMIRSRGPAASMARRVTRVADRTNRASKPEIFEINSSSWKAPPTTTPFSPK